MFSRIWNKVFWNKLFFMENFSKHLPRLLLRKRTGRLGKSREFLMRSWLNYSLDPSQHVGRDGVQIRVKYSSVNSPSGGLQLSPPSSCPMVAGWPKSSVFAGGFWMSSSRVWAVVIQRNAKSADSQSNETEPARQLIYKHPHGFNRRASSRIQ